MVRAKRLVDLGCIFCLWLQIEEETMYKKPLLITELAQQRRDAYEESVKKLLIRPWVTEFAQLSLDVYNDPKNDSLRRDSFSKLWVRIQEWPRKEERTVTISNPRIAPRTVLSDHDYDEASGFYAALYKHILTGIGVLAIRGTDASVLPDIVADYDYIMNKVTAQYEQVMRFWFSIRHFTGLRKINKLYVTGHSLGGIIAKMISPITGCDTIAFNSPGVREYLQRRELPTYKRTIEQKIITYCARADPIGNLRHDNDLGKYMWVDVKGGEKIPDSEDRLNSWEFLRDCKVGTEYHGMADMFKALKSGEYRNGRF